MREIKFDLIYKGETAFHHKKYYLSELMVGIDKICDIHEIMTLVAKRQFTGLKDKNGKEVYEGDLVDDFFGVGQIKEIRWNEKTACFCYYSNSLDFSWDGLDDTIIYGEVIGNIHENKELLDNAK